MLSFSSRAASLTLCATLVTCAPGPVPVDTPAIDAGVAAQVEPPPPVAPPVLPQNVAPPVLPQNVARAVWLEDIPDSHWTGLSLSDRCDAEGTPWIGWSLRPDVRDRPVHCAFDWFGDGAPDDLLLQEIRSDIHGLQRDPPAVVAQAELTPDLLKTWSEIRHKLMYERLGKPRVELKQTGRVRVAVIDTASGVDADVKDDDGHGSAMGLVIREIACTQPATCTQPRMFYYPALGRRTQAGRAVLAKDGSGRYGTRSDLAQAIERAVDDWMSAREAELQEAQAKGVRPPTPGLVRARADRDVVHALTRTAGHAWTDTPAIVAVAAGVVRRPTVGHGPTSNPRVVQRPSDCGRSRRTKHVLFRWIQATSKRENTPRKRKLGIAATSVRGRSLRPAPPEAMTRKRCAASIPRRSQRRSGAHFRKVILR